MVSIALSCATGEDDPQRKKPGGVVDGGNDSGGSGGVGGSAGSDGGGTGGSAGGNLDGGDASDSIADGASDAGVDAVVDAPSDAPSDAIDAAPDAGPTGRLLMIARSSSQVTFGEKSSGAWSTQTQTRSTLSAPAIATTTSGAVAVVRDQTANALSFSAWDPATGNWSAFASVAAGGATMGSPALAAPDSVHLAYLGTDFKLYSNVYTPGSGWQTTFTPVMSGAAQSFGPSAPALAVSGTGVMLAQEGNDGNLYTQPWQGGWQVSTAHPLVVKIKPGTPPAAATRPSTGAVVVVYVETGTNKLLWIEGSATTWSSPAAVYPTATSVSTPAVVGLPNGDVVVAYRAADDKVYATVMSGSSFGLPVVVHPSLGTTTSPALAPGIAGHFAELAWVSGGSVQHSHLGATGWSGPTAVVASGQLAVALATHVP